MRQRSRLRSFLAVALCSIVFAGVLACQTTRVGAPPPCPQWSDAAVLELWGIVRSGEYPALEWALGRQELHCEAIERLRSGES